MSNKTIIGAIAGAVVVLLAIVFFVVHRAHQIASPGGQAPASSQASNTSSQGPHLDIVWQAAPAQDQATEQADQQIHSELNDFADGADTLNEQGILSIFSPDFAFSPPGNRGGHTIRYKEIQSTLHHVLGRIQQHDPHFRDMPQGQLVVTACSVSGNTATVSFYLSASDKRHPQAQKSPVITATCANTGGKWLATTLQLPS